MRIKVPSNSQLAGWSLFLFGLGFFSLVVIDVGVHGWNAKAWTTYLAMLTSCLLALTGLSYLMPMLFSSIATRFIVLRALITGQPLPDVDKVKENLDFAFKPIWAVAAQVRLHKTVPGSDAKPPLPDEWNNLVRPVLHQASQYMAPTYYLNGNLQVIDWNLCFDLIFEAFIGELRGRHVNWFIARLKNSEAVFEHARAFPDRVEDQPQVDTEQLSYVSQRYGGVEFEKIATKLHDLDGQERGWAVTLMIRQIEQWDQLVRDLAARIEDDKFWSIYSVSYDRILNSFSGYDQLLESVLRGLPDGALRVVDLGSGTGNASRLILKGKEERSVWAVEKNMAMLDLFRSKDWVREAGDRIKIVKSSVEHLEMLEFEEPFEAAVAVNVLYAVDDVPACLASLNRNLQMGGTFVFSTTDKNTKLATLLEAIEGELRARPDWDELASHYARVRLLNSELEQKGITTRYTREQYCGWFEQAGFRVDLYEPGHYKGAVVVGQATKIAEAAPKAKVATAAPAVVETAAPEFSSMR